MENKGRSKRRKDRSASQRAKKLNQAVRFVETYIEKGEDVLNAVRIASRYYRVGEAEIREKLERAISAGIQKGSRIWSAEDLARHFGFSIHWVYKITRKKAIDPPPRCPGLGRLRFDTSAKNFQDWMARQTAGSHPIDSQGS